MSKSGNQSRERYNEYMRAYMLARYQRRRAQALEVLGGKCAECGSTEDLQIDHVKRNSKTNSLGRMLGGARWEKILRELEGCRALCASCHKEKSRKEASVEHGGGLTGKKNCRCSLCAPLKDRYLRNLRLRRAIEEAIQEQGSVPQLADGADS